MDSFLNECGLSDAIETFKQHKLEVENLDKLTESEIKELLPNIGDRHKLIDAILIRKRRLSQNDCPIEQKRKTHKTNASLTSELDNMVKNAFKEFSNDLFNEHQDSMPGWSLIDYDVGKLNCPLCVTQITPQFRKTIPIKWMTENYMRHFTDKHPDLKGCSNSYDKPHFFGEQRNFSNDNESLDPGNYVLRSCSVVLNVLEIAMSEEESYDESVVQANEANVLDDDPHTVHGENNGLLSVSSANLNYGNAGSATLTSNQAGSLVASSNLGLNRIATSASQAVNILRFNNNAVTTVSGGNTVQLAAVQRQLAVSNALNGNVSILQQGSQQPQQRILINANSMNNLNLNSVSSSEMEELSVPDLSTLLGGQPIQISQLGQQQHILTNATATAPSQTTIDTTNLNLNLNVNLNSGTVVNNGEGQVQQHQIAKVQGGEWTTTAQAPPFLVFISPLRPMSIATAGTTTRQLTASGTMTNPSTLSLNLGAVQASQQQLQTSQLLQNPPKVSEGATRILLGTCNNGVAIKRELPPSSVAASMSNVGGGGDSLGQNQIEPSVDGHLLDGQQVVSSSDVVVDGVDSLFNALSEAIGPEQLQKLDAMGGSLTAAASVGSSNVTTSQNPSAVIDTGPTGMKPPASSTVNMAAGIPTSSSGSANSNNKNNSTNVITLSDLLGSPKVVSSSMGNAFPSLILTSVNSSISGCTISTSSGSNTINSSPTLSSLLNSVTVSSAGGLAGIMSSGASSMAQSSIVSSTPRLSALLAGTPSADTIVGTNGPTSVMSPTGTADSSTGTNATSYGTLLDRLAASLNQPQGNTSQVRTGASRLNPIATATPSVVLDHPVLAATLTQQQQPTGPPTSGANRGSTFRQIAPAPSPASNLNATVTSVGNNVAVISSSDVQSHMQSPQLINLLGLVGNNSGTPGTGQTRTIRISASSPANNPSPGSASR